MITNAELALQEAALVADFVASIITEAELATGLQDLYDNWNHQLSTGGLAKQVSEQISRYDDKWSSYVDLTVKGIKALVSDLPTSGNTHGDLWWVSEATTGYPYGQAYVYITSIWVAQGSLLTKGQTGAGVISGGNTGQILAKNSATNYDTLWVNPSVVNEAAVVGKFGAQSMEGPLTVTAGGITLPAASGVTLGNAGYVYGGITGTDMYIGTSANVPIRLFSNSTEVARFGTATPLSLFASHTPATGKVSYFASGSTISLADSTSYGRGLWNLADSDALRTAIGIDIDGTLASNSDVKLPSQKAVKTYVDGIVNANDAFQLKGALDCSTNPNYPAASAGHTYRISVAGKIGGASGKTVEIGDIALCITDDTSAGTEAAVGANWIVFQVNIIGALTSADIGVAVQAYNSVLTSLTSATANAITFLATPSSANLRAAVTDETGTGALVFATSPTLVTPILGAAAATSIAIAEGNAATQALSIYRAGATAAYSSYGNSAVGFNGTLIGVDTSGNTVINNTQSLPILLYAGGLERLRVASDGNVGIGTTSPQALLQVAGTTFINTTAQVAGVSAAKFTVVQTAATGDWTTVIKGGTTTGSSYGLRVDGGTNSSDYALFVNNSSASNLFNVRGDGNVGIGTTMPQAPLHIKGTTDGNLYVRAASTALGGLTGVGLSSVNDAVSDVADMALQAKNFNFITDNTLRLNISATGGHVTPGADNTQNFGSGSLRWGTIYAGTGTINTSDERYKVLRSGGDLTDAEYRAWSNVRAIVYQDKDSFEEWGENSARLHVGYSWQRIKAAFENEGLQASRYGLWCEDPEMANVIKTHTNSRQALDETGQPLFEQVQKVDDTGEFVFETVQETETVEEQVESIEIVEGVPFRVVETRMTQVPLFDSKEIRDKITGEVIYETKEGEEPKARTVLIPRMVNKPVMENKPILEYYEEEYTVREPTGETRGALRYQECSVLETAWLRKELSILKTRLEALETA